MIDAGWALPGQPTRQEASDTERPAPDPTKSSVGSSGGSHVAADSNPERSRAVGRREFHALTTAGTVSALILRQHPVEVHRQRRQERVAVPCGQFHEWLPAHQLPRESSRQRLRHDASGDQTAGSAAPSLKGLDGGAAGVGRVPPDDVLVLGRRPMPGSSPPALLASFVALSVMFPAALKMNRNGVATVRQLWVIAGLTAPSKVMPQFAINSPWRALPA